MAVAAPHHPPLVRLIKQALEGLAGPIQQLGHILVFAGRAIRRGSASCFAATPSEFSRLLADVAWGTARSWLAVVRPASL